MRPFLGPPFPGMCPSALRRSRESRRFVPGLGIPGRPRRPPAYTKTLSPSQPTLTSTSTPLSLARSTASWSRSAARRVALFLLLGPIPGK